MKIRKALIFWWIFSTLALHGRSLNEQEDEEEVVNNNSRNEDTEKDDETVGEIQIYIELWTIFSVSFF